MAEHRHCGTYDPGEATPYTPPWWAVHQDPAPYEQVGNALEDAVEPFGIYWDVDRDNERYLGRPFVTIPDGYVLVDGVLTPTF
jgi:hypothetical protein